jgi:hypothetical protein
MRSWRELETNSPLLLLALINPLQANEVFDCFNTLAIPKNQPSRPGMIERRDY